MTLANLEWWGWILLALTLNITFVDLTRSALAIRAGKLEGNFLVSAVLITLMLYLIS